MAARTKGLQCWEGWFNTVKHSIFGVFNITTGRMVAERENNIIVSLGRQGSCQSEGGALIRTWKVLKKKKSLRDTEPINST